MSETLLANKYNSSKVEDKWYKYWIEKKYFHADSTSKKEPYTIVIPPPNVTGMLTVGHVLNNTIQVIYLLWLHVMMVEYRLLKSGLNEEI